MTIAVGDRLIAVEHDDFNGGAPKANGRRYLATVVEVGPIYAAVRYDDPGVFGGRKDTYYRESLWRAWDGALSWRLEPEIAPKGEVE